MKLELTDKVSGKKMIVDERDIMLLEPLEDGGSHIVLDPGMGRAVVEEYESLKAVIGAVELKVAQAMLSKKRR